jgi:hypothetical protein
MKRTFQRGNVNGNYVKVSLNTDKLEEIERALLAKYMTRVGILGSKTNRMTTETMRRVRKTGGIHKVGKSPSSLTNAEIGLMMEKGSLANRIPRRSFLEMPLVLKSAGLLAMKNKLWAIFEGGPETAARLKQAYVELGHAAERIIQAAFQSGGFGHWKPDSLSTMKRKGSTAPLIDTGQLRRSITSDVVNR